MIMDSIRGSYFLVSNERFDDYLKAVGKNDGLTTVVVIAKVLLKLCSFYVF